MKTRRRKGQPKQERLCPARQETDTIPNVRGNHPNQGRVDDLIRPPPGVTREVIVVGDSNVARFAHPLVCRVGDYRKIEVIPNTGGTTEDVHRLIDIYEEKAREVPRMYILHLGVNDILNGDQPDTIVERLRLKWSDRRAALAICSVPEIEGRGKEIQATTMLLNAKLKKLCKELKIRFIDLSRDLRGEGVMEKDGMHYKQEGVRIVTDRLGAVASNFLGIRWRRGPSPPKNEQWRGPVTLRGKSPASRSVLPNRGKFLILWEKA